MDEQKIGTSERFLGDANLNLFAHQTSQNESRYLPSTERQKTFLARVDGLGSLYVYHQVAEGTFVELGMELQQDLCQSSDDVCGC